MNELTSRQKEIASLAVLGLSNVEIAAALRVTPGVVRAELEALYRQTQPPGPDPMTRIDEKGATRTV